MNNILLGWLTKTASLAALLLATSLAHAESVRLTEAEALWRWQNPEVIVYARGDINPFLFRGEPGASAKGLAIDYVQAALDKLGISARYNDTMTLGQAQRRLTRRDGIQIVPIAVATPENKKRWALSEPYFSTPFVLFTRSDDAVIGSLEDMRDRRVAIIKSARYQDGIKRKFPFVSWVSYETPKQALGALATGAVDGAIAALAVGRFLINEHGLTNLKVAAEMPLPVVNLAFAVNKKDAVFAGMLSKALGMITPEEHKAIRDRWLTLRIDHGLDVRDLAFWVGAIAGPLTFIIVVIYRTMRRLRREISWRKRSQQELRRANELFECAINATTDAFVIFDKDDRLVICNEVYRRYRPEVADVLKPGISHDELMRIQVQRQFPELTADEVEPLVQERCVQFRGDQDGREVRNSHGRWLRMAAYRMSDGGTVFVRTDITNLKQAQEELTAKNEQLEKYNATLEQYAYYDLLTGLANRKLFTEFLDRSLKLARRRQESLSLLMVDLDKFKAINDTLGHVAGDEALRIVGDRIKQTVREADFAARLGGDEFAIISMSQNSTAGATELARKIITAVEQPLVVDGAERRLGCSIGIAHYPEHGNDRESLLRSADAAMYLAKNSGRGIEVSKGPASGGGNDVVVAFDRRAGIAGRQ